jgi:hypothetical protein
MWLGKFADLCRHVDPAVAEVMIARKIERSKNHSTYIVLNIVGCQSGLVTLEFLRLRVMRSSWPLFVGSPAGLRPGPNRHMPDCG